MNRKKHRHFLVFKGLETSCVRNRGEGSVYNHLLQTNGSGVRGVDPRMSMKNLNLLSIKWVVGVGACGQWVWFLFCVRRHVPLVHRELFWGEGTLVVKKKQEDDFSLTTTQVQTVMKDGTRARPTRWAERPTLTQKHENQTEHFWPNFNTRLILFFLLLLLEPIVVRM